MFYLYIKEAKFIGFEALEANKKKLGKKRAGFIVVDKGILRAGTILEDAEGNEVGSICSGTHGPTLGKSVGMCYVKPPFAKVTSYELKEHEIYKKFLI